MRTRSWGLALVLVVLAGFELGGDPAALVGSTVSDAAACQWPTAVLLGQGGCSGVLIHPQVVLTAGHCIGDGPGPAEVRFGESVQAPQAIVATSSCARHPEADGSVSEDDYGYCVLAEPVDLAIVPPLLGCELDWLEVGQPLLTVGWGNGTGGPGIKRISGAELLGLDAGMLGAAVEPNEVCDGDSGGPTFVRLPDGSWRVAGINVGGPAGSNRGCVTPLLIVPAQTTIAWVEAQTGIDVSPCHLADGTWSPSPACTGFAADPIPWTGGKQWQDGSCEDPRTGPAATCGPSFEHAEESEAPSVEILSPADASEFPNAPAWLDVVVAADDGDGVAVLGVALLLDGQPLASESVDYPLAQPQTWMFADLELDAGVHELRATATDHWGNVGTSEAITIVVGDAGGAGSDGGDELGADADGCACAAGRPRAGLAELGLLGLMALLGLRARRR